MTKDTEIVVIGLGYVGLSLAVEFGKVRRTLGIDQSKSRIVELKNLEDRNGEVAFHKLKSASKLLLDDSLKESNEFSRIYIITVPTPIDNFKNPDLSHLKRVSQEVGKILKKGDLVVYESTTYPTCTRDFCIPILEEFSFLSHQSDFGVGYCPERVSPGKNHRSLDQIVRVISATHNDYLILLESVYESIGQKTYKVSSLEVAEMSKMTENCQRDLNISFVNEIALICDKLGLSTNEVLKAAQTKWNFHPYEPGLVGGHCISVDPYYLIHKAEALGYFPKLIGAGREINEAMPAYVASKCIKLLLKKGIPIQNARAIVLGLTFKENCKDVRNSKAFDLINELAEYGINVEGYDPYLENEKSLDYLMSFDLMVLTVPHEALLQIDFSKRKKNSVLFDLKGVLKDHSVDGSL